MDYSDFSEMAGKIPQAIWEHKAYGTKADFEKLLENAYHMGRSYGAAAGRHEDVRPFYFRTGNRMTGQMHELLKSTYAQGIIDGQEMD